MTTDTTPASPAPVLDPAYLDFLRQRLPLLRRKSIPFWHRRRLGKRETLAYCLRRVPIDAQGLIAEFGVYRGGSIRMIAERHADRTVYGFDSFEGFPDDGRSDWQQDFSTGGNLPAVPSNVRLIKGYFDDTLPEFVAAHAGERLAMIHVDCDIYSSTKSIFRLCRPLIRPGCLIVFDELLHYNGFLPNEMLAFWEFLRETGADFEWVAINGKVMLLDEFLAPTEKMLAFMKTMGDWRKAGYHQVVALRITSMP